MLEWIPNTETDLAGYNVYYGTATGNYDIMINVGDQTSYTVTGLEEGKTYYFAATAYDTSGNESDYSTEASETIPVQQQPPVEPGIGSPKNLLWDPVLEEGIVGYKVYYGFASRVYEETFDAGNQTRYTLAGFEPGRIYYFAVTAYNEDGIESDYSEELVWTMPAEQICSENENVVFNKPVEDGGEIYKGMPGSNAVDGIKNTSGNFWAGRGTPNSLVIDLEDIYAVDRIVARPYGQSSVSLRYYYNDEWNIQYSLDGLQWEDFTGVSKLKGSGILSGNGIYITGGNPGEGDHEEYKEYEFSVAPVKARYIRFYVSKGDVDNDANLEEIEIFPSCDPCIAGTDIDNDGIGDTCDPCIDGDGDGYGIGANISGCSGSPVETDCDDKDVARFPGNLEICDGRDNDCNVATADGSVETPPDNSNQEGVCAGSKQTCSGAAGWQDDYSITKISDYEALEASCDNKDNDCDGLVDEGVITTYYYDNDRDGFGDVSLAEAACSAPENYVTDNTDCDDTDSARFPGNLDLCDGKDNDCDIATADGASESPPDNSNQEGVCEGSKQICMGTQGWANDYSAARIFGYEGLETTCDGLDNDCDGQIDAGLTSTYYFDFDGDSYGDAATITEACVAPEEYVDNAGDCEDTDPNINPAMPELPDNGVDDDCNLDTLDDPTVYLYFPMIKDGWGWNNYLTVQGTESQDTDITLYAYNADGSLAGVDTETIPALGSYTARPGLIAGKGIAVDFDGTIVVESEQPIIGQLTTIGPNSDTLDVYAAVKAKTFHFYPKIWDEFQDWRTVLHLQNTNSVSCNIEVELVNDYGTSEGMYEATLSPYEKFAIQPMEITGASFIGTMTVTADLPVAAIISKEYAPGTNPVALSVYKSIEERTALYFPRIHDGLGGERSFLSILNTDSSESRNLTLGYFDDFGNLLFAESQTLVPGGRYNVSPSWAIYGEFGHDYEGLIIVTADGPVAALADTVTPFTEAYDSREAAVPGPVLYFPKIIDGYYDWTSSVAIQNIDSLSRVVSIELFNDDGTFAGTKSVIIAPYGKYNFRPRDIHGAEFDGSIIVEADEPVCATVTRENDRALTINEGISP